MTRTLVEDPWNLRQWKEAGRPVNCNHRRGLVSRLFGGRHSD